MLINFHTHHPVPNGVITPLSAGIHPWDDETCIVPPPADKFWHGIDIVGECGLDRRRGPDISIQIQRLEQQLAIAESMKKPVVIHCVHALDLILQLRHKYNTTPWVMHGFRAGKEQANQLLQHGIYISVGVALLNPSTRLVEAIRDMGTHRLLLETDDSDEDIANIYATAAQVMDVKQNVLEDAIYTHYTTLLGKE